MICRNCGCRYESRTVGFKTTCENCNEYLHSCFNCALYNSNADRCRSLTTEAVSDRKGNNYCEEFTPNNDTVPEMDSGAVKSAVDFKALFRMDGK